MVKTTVLCDCCKKEMTESNGYELDAQLRVAGDRALMIKAEKPVVALKDLCDPCAEDLYNVISTVLLKAGQRVNSAD